MHTKKRRDRLLPVRMRCNRMILYYSIFGEFNPTLIHNKYYAAKKINLFVMFRTILSFIIMIEQLTNSRFFRIL
jgi:hypothetical protein